jgi:hypothetical protein
VRVDLGKLSAAAEGMSFAEIVKACDEAMKGALLLGRDELRTVDLLTAVRERQSFLRRGR